MMWDKAYYGKNAAARVKLYGMNAELKAQKSLIIVDRFFFKICTLNICEIVCTVH